MEGWLLGTAKQYSVNGSAFTNDEIDALVIQSGRVEYGGTA
jgi:hypothetical protein